MSLYKDQKDMKIFTDVKVSQKGEKVEFTFSCDGGKFGTHEMLSDYEITAEQLLNIFTSIDKQKESTCRSCGGLMKDGLLCPDSFHSNYYTVKIKI